MGSVLTRILPAAIRLVTEVYSGGGQRQLAPVKFSRANSHRTVGPPQGGLGAEILVKVAFPQRS